MDEYSAVGWSDARNPAKLSAQQKLHLDCHLRRFNRATSRAARGWKSGLAPSRDRPRVKYNGQRSCDRPRVVILFAGQAQYFLIILSTVHTIKAIETAPGSGVPMLFSACGRARPIRGIRFRVACAASLAI